MHTNQAFRASVQIKGDKDKEGNFCSLKRCEERKQVEEQSGKSFTCEHIELARKHLDAPDGQVEKFTVKQLKEELTSSLFGKEINDGISNLLTNLADNDTVGINHIVKHTPLVNSYFKLTR